MLRYLFIMIVSLSSVVHGEEMVRTSSRTFELLNQRGRSDPHDDMQSVVTWANVALVPALRSATSIEIFSLDPNKYKKFPKGTPKFHEYCVLGSVVVGEKERVQRIRNSMITGIAPGGGALCYSPRHGIRIKGKQGVVDIEICFECGQSGVHGVKQTMGWSFIKEETEDLLNEVLDEAKIERDMPKKEGRATE